MAAVLGLLLVRRRESRQPGSSAPGARMLATSKARYHGVDSCAAAVAVTGGGGGCTWGCVGLSDCAVACDFYAITMSAFGLPVVDPEAADLLLALCLRLPAVSL